MSVSKEKLSKKKLDKIRGNEISVTMFIRTLKKMYPKISHRELVKLVARYKGVSVSAYWVMDTLNQLSQEDFQLEIGMGTEEHELLVKENERAIAQLNDVAISSVRQLVDDNKELAKSIKVKMMDEVEDRLLSDPEIFTNDELIRGSKTFHEIEQNMGDNQVVNFNFLSPDSINETINKLNNKLNGEREGVIETTGEVQVG